MSETQSLLFRIVQIEVDCFHQRGAALEADGFIFLFGDVRWLAFHLVVGEHHGCCPVWGTLSLIPQAEFKTMATRIAIIYKTMVLVAGAYGSQVTIFINR